MLALAFPLASTAVKPNIVYIVADDLGWKDVGFQGSDIKTHNIDELEAAMAKPLTMRTEFNAMRERLHMPPALPGEEMMFNEEN